MLATTITTGTEGTLKIEDNTDHETWKVVQVFIRTDVSLPAQTLNYSYETSATISPSVQLYDLETGNTDWQLMRSIWVGSASWFTLYFDDTETTELGGPTELNVTLLGAPSGDGPGSVRVGSIYQHAQPYVRVDGVWKPATAFLKVDGVWRQTV